MFRPLTGAKEPGALPLDDLSPVRLVALASSKWSQKSNQLAQDELTSFHSAWQYELRLRTERSEAI